jgi:hypothetical protein
VISSPVAFSTDGAVSCGVMLWRFQRRLQLTVIVKATFALGPDGAAVVVAPGEILTDDRAFDRHPSRSVEAAGDLVPYRARCDVTLIGHAHAPGGQPAPAGTVRLGISRDGRPLLDKAIHVFGDRQADGAPQPFTRMSLAYERAVGGPGEANPVGVETPNLVDPRDPRRPAGFGPISRFWPARKRLLGAVDRRALDGPVAEIPDAMAWDYFQAAPPDQQVEHLHGSEWIVLDGLHPTLPRVQVQLAGVRGAARVFQAQAPGAAPASSPVELVCDTLAIDADRQTFSLVWRGRHEVTGGEAALSSLRVAAALESPGAPIDWARLASTTTGAAPESGPARAPEPAGEATMALPQDEPAGAHGPLTPFTPSGTTPAARPASADATPWGELPMRPAPQAGRAAATLAMRSPGAGPAGEETMALRSDVADRPIAPFALSRGEHADRRGDPQAGAALPGAPWSGPAAPIAVPAVQAGEGTLALGGLEPPRPPPLMTPIAPVAPPSAATPAVALTPAAAPPPVALAPTAAAPPPVAPPPAARPVARQPARPPPPAPRPPVGPEALASKLAAAGASAADIADLLRALKPPPPPPDDVE